jgi:cell division protease FtsH
MITKWGLSERLGPLTYNQENEEVFLGHQIAKNTKFSDDTAQLIDEESRNIIDRNYKLAETLLQENVEKLHLMADALIKYETIDSSQINDIMEGKPPREPKGWNNVSKKDTSSSSEKKSPRQKDTTISGTDPAPDSL